MKAPEQKRLITSPILQLTTIYLVFVLMLIFAFIASLLLDIPIKHLTADPAMIYKAHPFTGLLSNFGVLLWCATASVTLFSSMVLRTYRSKTVIHFLLYSGLITLLLCLDDLFMLHEAVFPWHLRIPQKMVYAIYILFIGGYFFYFLKQILQTEYILFFIALLFLGASLAGDLFLPQKGVAYLFEDSLKLFGIGAWFLYFVRYSRQQFNFSYQLDVD